MSGPIPHICRPPSPGPRQLTGTFEGLSSQVKANPSLLLEIWASTLSYRPRNPGRRSGWVEMRSQTTSPVWTDTEISTLISPLPSLGVAAGSTPFRQILGLCCCCLLLLLIIQRVLLLASQYSCRSYFFLNQKRRTRDLTPGQNP